MSKTACAVAFLLGALLLSGRASAQDADEVARLKRENDLLKRENAVRTKEIEQLKKEIEQLKAGGAKAQPAAKPGTLADLLTEGTTIRGDYRFRAGIKATGDWSLTIKELKGKKFKGVHTAKETSPNKGEGSEFEAEGEIDGNQLKFTIVNTTKIQASAGGTLKKDTIELVWNGRAGIADMKAKAPK